MAERSGVALGSVGGCRSEWGAGIMPTGPAFAPGADGAAFV